MTTLTKSPAEVRRGWLEAAKMLALDPTLRVRCPTCEDAYLDVNDIDPGSEYDAFERRLNCPNCGTEEFLRLKKAGRVL